MTATAEFNMLQQIEGCGYEPIERIGGGSYGVVWGVLDNGQGKVAYKYIAPYEYQDFGLDSLNEVDIATRIDHPYVAHAYKVVTARDCKINGLALLQPEGDRRTLMEVANNKIPNLTFDHKLFILYRLATALDFLHDHHILHLDIKLDNVVLKGDNLHPYLIDFGLSMVVDDVVTGFYNPSKFVTINYRAPEILNGGRQYNAAVDVWAFGIMMLYVFTGKEYHQIRGLGGDTSFTEKLLLDVVTKFDNPATYPQLLDRVPPAYRDISQKFFLQVLNTDPARRLTAREIVNHPIFDGVRFAVHGTVIEPSLNDPAIYDYSADHQSIINILIQWADRIYPEAPAELLFLGIDLYVRTAAMHKDPATYNRRLALAAAALWVASKLVRVPHIRLRIYVPLINREIPLLKTPTMLDPEDLLQAEVDLVNRTQGRLEISNLYRSCRTAQQLAISLKYVVGYEMVNHDPTLYPRTSVGAWINYMEDPTNTWVMDLSPPDKRIKINKLIDLAGNIQLH